MLHLLSAFFLASVVELDPLGLKTVFGSRSCQVSEMELSIDQKSSNEILKDVKNNKNEEECKYCLIQYPVLGRNRARNLVEVGSGSIIF
jgi:hypothetical protein